MLNSLELEYASNVVIYHKNCSDGFTAAWIFNKYLEGPTFFLAAHHGDEPPPVKGKNVYILDFSYSREIIEKLHSEAKSLKVIDHHVSAQKNLEGLDYCHFDLNHSGAMLAWKYFEPDREAPILVKLVEDRDLWKWEIPGSKYAALTIRCFKFDFIDWDVLSTLSLEELVERGKYIWGFKQRGLEHLQYQAKVREFKGYTVPVVNCTDSRMRSDIGSLLCEGYPFAIVWSAFKNGEVLCSLRSDDNGIDVAEFAKTLGGGGHSKAAGIRVKVTEVLDWFE